MTAWLRSPGYHVNHKRVARLMHTMGIEAISPKPHLRQTPPAHRVYPYWLRGVPITRVNQVWSTDITYMRLHGGFIYLVAVMDGCSRYVLSWAVSITMEVGFCLAALAHALEVARPEIFNRDQGAQFTSLDFTGRLAAAGIQIRIRAGRTTQRPRTCEPSTRKSAGLLAFSAISAMSPLPVRPRKWWM
jgi:putative transposase